jgi:hypothetical protein
LHKYGLDVARPHLIPSTRFHRNHALANKLAEYFREMGYDVNIYTLERSGGYMYNGFMSFTI